MTLKELKPKLLGLTTAEKVAAIELLTQSLAWPGIEKTPGVCGGDACIAGTRIPVWLLVGYRRDRADNAHILEGYPQLTETDLENAWAYVAQYPDEIKAAIKRNEED